MLYKMMKLGIPYKFIKYTRHFLSARKTRVEVNGCKSSNFYLNEGLPQGSAISPLLFLLFINDIDNSISEEATPSLFADDTAVWVAVGRSKEEAEQKMQSAIDKISKWADDWKMKLNKGKTEAMVISSSSADLRWQPNLKLDGIPVKIVKEYRFLGVTIDGGLRFTTHVNNIIAKGKKRNNILRCLAGKDWGQNLETQKGLYSTYIRSAMEYASSSWYQWISVRNKERLEAVQNESLRIMTRSSKTCPRDFLRLETGIEPLEARMEKNAMINWEKYARMEESDAQRLLKEKEVKNRLTTRIGWRNLTKPMMAEFECNRQTPKTRVQPWRRINANFTKVILEKKKENYTTEQLKQMTLDKIEEVNADVELYTDGSTSGTQLNGGAGISIRDKEGRTLNEVSKPAGRLCSSYDGECVAMEVATSWINDQESTGLHYLILTDSESLVEALDSNKWRDKHEWLKRVKMNLIEATERITICWIPSHCGTDGNERADALANRGAGEAQEDAPVTYSIVRAKVRRKKWKIQHERASEVFGDRRKPKFEIEKGWPLEIRRNYGRFRSNHSKELKSFRKFIQIEEDEKCSECGWRKEDIKHVLCECPTLEAKRRELHHEPITIDMMVTHPELCRKILASKYKTLKLPKERNPIERRDVEQPVGLLGDSGLVSLE